MILFSKKSADILVKWFGRILIVLFFCNGCFPENEYDYPLVLTGAVTNISGEGAHFHGKISYLGDKDAIDHGFVWDTTSNPDISSAYFSSLGPAESTGFFDKNIIASLEEGKVYKVRTFVKTKNVIVYGQDVEFVSLGSMAPQIDSIAPARGIWGDTLTISGTAFGYKLEEIDVYFDSLKTCPLESTDSTLRVILPYDVGISPVDIFVEVLGNRTHSPVRFSFLLPIVDQFMPKEGYYNVPVTITGKNYHLDFSKVFFNDIPATILEITDTSILVHTPLGLPGGDVTLSVSVAGQTVTADEKFISLRHSLDAFEPEEGTFNDEIVITGNLFPESTDSLQVFFGDRSAEIISTSVNQVVVKVPERLFEKHSYIRVVFHEETVTFEQPFKLLSPVIDGFSPHSGTFGCELSISGDNFNPNPSNNEVDFNGSRAEVIASNKNEIIAKLPNACIAPDGNVEISVGYGEISILADEYFQLDIHEVTSLTPTSYERGDIIRIGGMNFNPHQHYNKVYIGDYQLNIISGSRTELVCDYHNIIDHGTYSVSYETGGRIVSALEELTVYEPWKRLADYPGYDTRSAIGFSVDGKGYLADRGYGAALMEFWEYDPLNNTWLEKNELPGASTITFSINNVVYVGCLEDYFKYDHVNDTWTEIAYCPGNIYMGAAVFSIQDKAYLVCGHHNTGYQYDKVWAYDPAGDFWEEKANFPGGAATGLFGFAIDGVGYAGGFIDSREFWSYDAAADSWTRVQDMIDPAVRNLRSMVIDGKAYVVSNDSSITYVYDPQIDHWSKIIGLPSPRERAAAFTIGNLGYIGTGGEFNEPSVDFYQFDPTKIKPE